MLTMKKQNDKGAEAEKGLSSQTSKNAPKKVSRTFDMRLHVWWTLFAPCWGKREMVRFYRQVSSDQPDPFPSFHSD